MSAQSYCLISPCRDESRHMRRTLDSVVQQSRPPARWVIVDDGSTDDTPQILAEYAARYDFIHVVRRADQGHRSIGPGVVDAFYEGYRAVNPSRYAYLCKLDMDVELPPRYFETLIERMEHDPRLGTCSGKPYFIDRATGRLISEACGDEMSVGMTKFYRRECFDQIGGFVRQVMWDGIDCHRCRMLGWRVASWDEPNLRFVHLRPMGASDQGVLRGRMRHGFGQYFMGTGPLYMTVSVLYRMTQRPWVLGGLAMWLGYFKAMLSKQQRYDDPTLRRFLRRYHRTCLLKGKARATSMFEQRHAENWQSPPPRSPIDPWLDRPGGALTS